MVVVTNVLVGDVLHVGESLQRGGGNDGRNNSISSYATYLKRIKKAYRQPR